MRVVFMGTPDFAVPSLQAVLDAGHEVALVVAQPDRPAGRGRKPRSPPVAEHARALGLELMQPTAVRRGALPERLAALAPEVIAVVAYGRILPPSILELPAHGCVNVHASLLPRWRGASPIQAAILAGDPVTGVCTQRMEEGLDTGPVYLCERTPIGPHETAGALHDRLAVLGAEVLVRTLGGLPALQPRPQPEDGVTWAPKIDKEDGRIDLAEDAWALDRRVRAMSPWPGGFLARPDGPLKLLEVRPEPGEGPPGTVLSVSPLRVACGRGALELVRVQAPGRRPVSGTDFANGARLRPGEVL